MNLFHIDLNQIVSKYVNKTKKNLKQIFNKTNQSHNILLFNKTNSLFTKKTKIKSTTNHYTNLKINYLLQQIKNFNNITILTTNFKSNINDTFKQHIHFRIKFPFPKQKNRELL